MTEYIITLLENYGFIKNGRMNNAQIEESTFSDLIGFCEEFSQITSYKNYNPETTIYTHSASLPLGGNRTPCSSLKCRVSKVKKMTQFAALVV